MTRKQQLRRNGPMFCKNQRCVAFRKREPKFAKQLQDAGIIAHYMGHDNAFGEELWMLDGITPVTRSELKRWITN